jgi:tyrosyl-tRNA synthetase
MALARLQRFGHSPIAIAGGGTGLIGDPSGKTQERALLTADQVAENLEGIKDQLSRFLDFHATSNPARIINNAEWLGTVDLMTFLRDIGKHFTVNYILAKESVKRRLEQEEGISFTEFSYLLLQAYDFLVLYDRFGCTLQMGGSDQWGNITAGCDLIRKLRGARAHGLVLPLVTTSSGVKFGKTEAGTVWLDPARTSAFHFYQFWLNTDDRDTILYLKFFTFRSESEIREIEADLARAPETREAQRILARDVTALVHGPEQMHRAEQASRLLFGAGISDRNVSVADVLTVFDDVPSIEMRADVFAGAGLSVVDLLAEVKLAPSKSEARRLVQAGGVYINDRRISDERARLTLDDAIDGQLFVIRKGQRQNHLVRIMS